MFEYMTTLENLMLGRHNHYKSGFFTDMFNLKGFKKEETKNREKVEHVIDFLGLERYRDFPVGILPYGVLKRIELGRALCMDPKILLLDEPAAGLNQEETEDLARYILDIKEELGITQILIEHELHLVLDLADQIHVFDFGSRIASGVPEKIKNNPAVIKAYLGQEEDF